MKYVYIHGFNSGPESRSGRELEEILGVPVFRAHMDYSRSFASCMADLYEQLNSLYPERATESPGEGLCLLGASLGGFYAMQVRRRGIGRVIAWNPVVFPAIQLKQFLGFNTRFTDGVQWKFELVALLSYAKAPDPRYWRNNQWRAMPLALEVPRPDRTVFIGTEDELLDPALAISYWSASSDHGITVKQLPCGHSVPDYHESLAWALNRTINY